MEIKRINRAKRKYQKLSKGDTSDLFFSTKGKTKIIHLKSTSVIKMAKIKIDGDVTYVYNYNSKNLSVKTKGNTILVRNRSKKHLANDILVKFRGSLSRIISARIYKWNEKSHIPKLINNRNDSIDKNDDLVSSTDLEFKSVDSNRFSYKKTKRQKTLKHRKYATILKNQFSKKSKFLHMGKIYVGSYHYHPETNTFMTGKKHTNKSVVLKKIHRRRKNGI